ncbi:MAG: hypothetical protein EZS28_023358 [Streblomastix strix]|uniref:Uncharacterized protein n=1 Tax=Streblomastix strix TaxID=222440 RepID=A0A5J4VET1_9EUKA|nr:MAG: hypothetical protein EZS28_023358 [Streblomastix strix]
MNHLFPFLLSLALRALHQHYMLSILLSSLFAPNPKGGNILMWWDKRRAQIYSGRLYGKIRADSADPPGTKFEPADFFDQIEPGEDNFDPLDLTVDVDIPRLVPVTYNQYQIYQEFIDDEDGSSYMKSTVVPDEGILEGHEKKTVMCTKCLWTDYFQGSRINMRDHDCKPSRQPTLAEFGVRKRRIDVSEIVAPQMIRQQEIKEIKETVSNGWSYSGTSDDQYALTMQFTINLGKFDDYKALFQRMNRKQASNETLQTGNKILDEELQKRKDCVNAMVFDLGYHKSRHSTVGIVVSPTENFQPLPVTIEENIQTTAEYASFISRTICGLHHKGVIVSSVTIDGLRAQQKASQSGNDN